jgi:hypothetical protein
MASTGGQHGLQVERAATIPEPSPTPPVSRVLAGVVLWCYVLSPPLSRGIQQTNDTPPEKEFILEVGSARLQVDVAGTTTDVPLRAVIEHIRHAAQAVSIYYGHFPVRSARIRLFIVPGRHSVLQGTTWGHMDGFPGVTRLRIGEHTTAQELDADWMATHELVHMALPSLLDEQHWLEEGIATYVEPIARAQLGELSPQDAWQGMLEGLPKGEPEDSDQGLDRTHTWGRTYWGGALFCLVAEIEIRKQTGNARGLRDALRGIVDAGGAIDKDWPIAKVLAIGDKATGTAVLEDLYKKWSKTPVTVDLPLLWNQLGVHRAGDTVSFDATAPLARIRESITAAPRPSAPHVH